MHSPGHVAATDEQAREELWPHYLAMMNRIGRERGWPPRDATISSAKPVPTARSMSARPDTVAQKIVRTVTGAWAFAVRYEIQQRNAASCALMKSIELFGTRVAPMVRASVPGA